MTIRFLTAKCEMLQLDPNGHLFFYSEIRIRIVPKRSFVLWLRNTKFLKLFRNFNLLFENKLRNLKLHPNCHLFFDHKILNLKLYSNGLSFSDYKQRKWTLNLFLTEFLITQKIPAKLFAILSENFFENRRKEFISFVLIFVLCLGRLTTYPVTKLLLQKNYR